MASKTQKRRQKEKKKAVEIGSKETVTVNAASAASIKKVNHGNGTRKNLKHKQKIRSGHQTSYDIYEEFAEKNENLKEGIACSTCNNLIRTKGYCVWCATTG
ncbi:hypothetical protein XU18_0646 [Perkinsela sp. CCAP 1560/4]|nr:hypothetical protein XU18_2391 [Perkinsela sp. CCAP 1560/4]KNH09051.1 hypothetical protein XU18_0646 [Perkinsela sp. CCAP 1560/4]|eukprot:KNH06789.1 hypothetical protein XU18_2391 [Perkinsela sp. CCAP 1560/4]